MIAESQLDSEMMELTKQGPSQDLPRITLTDHQRSFFKFSPRVLFVFLLITCFVSIVLLIATNIYWFDKQQCAHPRICESPECVEIAGDILRKLDRAVEPCDDFFQYSCGNWIKNNYIPFSRSYIGEYVQGSTYRKLLARIESWNHLNVSSARKKVSHLYLSCVNQSVAMDSNGEELLLNFIDDLGGTSILGAASANISIFKKSLKTLLTKYFLHCFMRIQFDNIPPNIGTKVIIIEPFLAVLPSSKYYLNISGNGSTDNRIVYDFYKKLMKNTYRILGSPLSGHEIDAKVNDIVALETKMMNLSLQLSRFETESFNLSSLPHSFDFFDFKDFIMSLVASANVSTDDVEYVKIVDLSLFQNLDVLFRSENPDTLRNYVTWVGVYQTMSWSSKALSSYRIQLDQLLEGLPIVKFVLRPRWIFCIDKLIIHEPINKVVGFEYVKNNKLDRVRIKDVMERIQSAFKIKVGEATWIDVESQETILERFENLSITWGNPDQLRNENIIELEMKKLDIEPNSYFQNRINLWKESKVESYRRNYFLDQFLIQPYMVKAFYTNVVNEALFQNAIFQRPFFHSNWTHSQIFGAIGMIIGHEFVHMFPYLGPESDVYRIKILSEHSHEKFTEMSSCLIEQYNSYESYGESVKGFFTFNENFADNVGLSIAYRAFEDWVNENGHERDYPGIDLTEKQLFFVSFAQQFCAKYSKESYLNYLSVNYHAPFKYRVIGTLSNSKEFSHAFSCKHGSRMNPNKKCQFI